MQGSSWLLAAVFLCGYRSGVEGQCWDIAACADLGSQDKIMECIWQCNSKQLVFDADNILPNQQQNTAEEEEKESLGLGVLLSSVAQDGDLQAKRSSTGPFQNDDRRTYSMEHFRWGKPMGRKRRPVKVFMGTSVEEASPEEKSVEKPSRRQLYSAEEGAPLHKKNMKGPEKYRMTHFRWNAPSTSKRYGGFMKPWSEKSNKTLVTLLRNIIIKDGQ
ncbi:proopiomelanocortin b [Hoplias malabaricus]|uniref:proopiomelanocortin b n=1 Tax=Hoplias malabaricus TaxID=27720 RepID=UPI003461D68C